LTIRIRFHRVAYIPDTQTKNPMEQKPIKRHVQTVKPAPPNTPQAVLVKENKVVSHSELEIDSDPIEKFEKKLELTPEEAKNLTFASGIRGQIKKLLRPYKDDQVAMRSFLNHFKTDIVDRLNKSLNQMDREYKGLYAGMMKRVMGPVDQKLGNLDLYITALTDEVARKLHYLESKSTPEGANQEDFKGYFKSFQEIIVKRAEVIHKEIQDKRNLEVKAQQKKAEEDSMKRAKKAKQKRDAKQETKNESPSNQGSDGKTPKDSEVSGKDGK